MWRLRRVWTYIRRDIPYGIQNLIEWFPIIWRNRGWDWFYMVEIIRKQAQVMRDQQAVANHVDWKELYDELNKVVADCDILLDCDNDDWTGPGEKKMLRAQRDIGVLFAKRLRYWWD